MRRAAALLVALAALGAAAPAGAAPPDGGANGVPPPGGTIRVALVESAHAVELRGTDIEIKIGRAHV